MPFSGIEVRTSFLQGLQLDNKFAKVSKCASKCIRRIIQMLKYCTEDAIAAGENLAINQEIEAMIVVVMMDQRSTMNYGKALFFIKRSVVIQLAQTKERLHLERKRRMGTK